jgi:transcriptional regulator with XRE-family HTH domain
MGGQEIKAILGKNVKFFRFHRQLSQADLAEKANISVTFLSNIERGNKFPQAETLFGLAKGLDIEVYELFKPDSVPDETSELVSRFFEDITKNVNQTLETVYKHYKR